LKVLIIAKGGEQISTTVQVSADKPINIENIAEQLLLESDIVGLLPSDPDLAILFADGTVVKLLNLLGPTADIGEATQIEAFNQLYTIADFQTTVTPKHVESATFSFDPSQFELANQTSPSINNPLPASESFVGDLFTRTPYFFQQQVLPTQDTQQQESTEQQESSEQQNDSVSTQITPDTYVTNEDELISGNLLANDIGEGLTIAAKSGLTAMGATYILLSNGTFFYDPTSIPSINTLSLGDFLTDTVTYTVTDSAGNVFNETVNVTIDGADDTPVITGDTTGGAQEDTTLSATGTATATDADAGESGFVANAGISGSYGDLAIDNSGNWTYSLNNASVQSLGAGETLLDVINVITNGGDSTPISITITGTNDAAIISGDTTGGVHEDSTVLSTATGTLTSSDIDNADNSFTATTGSSTYGTYSIDAGGNWTYTLDNSNPTVDDLDDGETISDSFSVTSVDGTSQVINITINGNNEGVNTTTGEVIEDVDLTDSGDLPGFIFPNSGSSTYGTYSVSWGGGWNYTLDNGNPTVDALNAGDTLIDTFVASGFFGSGATVTITIVGTNDDAIIGGTTIGNASEDGMTTVNGTLTATDVDDPDNTFTTATNAGSDNGYGTYSIDASGNWTYSLDNGSSTIQGLAQGETLIDTFTVTSIDGTAQPVTITITGANDQASITGTDIGSVSEDSMTSTTGSLTVTDVDSGEAAFNTASGAASTNGYGTYSIDSSGNWTYALDNGSGTIQDLGQGDTLLDSFTATTIDGTTETVNITITGTNDVAVITGDNVGDVRQTSDLVDSGTLAITDVDSGEASFISQSSVGSVNGYGTYDIDTSGNWTYNLDNANPAVAALNPGDTLLDSFVVTSVDGGTTETISITVKGPNVPPTVNDESTTIIEDNDLSSFNVLANDSDTDGDTLTVTGANATNGDVTVNPDNTIDYEPDEHFSGTDFVTYTVSDGEGGTATGTLTVTVTPDADEPYLLVPKDLLSFTNTTGDFNSGLGIWETGGTVNQEGSGTTYSDSLTGTVTISPFEGSGMMSLEAEGESINNIESALNLASGTLDSYAGSYSAQDGAYSLAVIYAEEGDTISFDWNFASIENQGYINSGYDDVALVVIDGQEYELAQGSTVGSVTTSGWSTYTFTAAQTGLLMLGFTVFNVRDTSVDSALAIDNITVNGDVLSNARPVPLHLEAFTPDTDGSETTSIEVTLPSGFVTSGGSLSAGLQSGNTWTLTPSELNGLTLNVPNSYTGNVTLNIQATATETANGDTSTVNASTTIEVNEVESFIVGTSSNDNISGTNDDEYIYGGDGADIIDADRGDDIIRGGAGDDDIDAGRNDDIAYGDSGNDFIDGGRGEDIIIGGEGNDTLTGGDDNDLFVWEAGDEGTIATPAIDTITDFNLNGGSNDEDQIDLSDLLSGSGIDADNLDSYLHFDYNGVDTTIQISTTGNVGSSYDQEIIVEGVDLTGGLSSDTDIINDLLSNNKIIVDI